MNGYGKWSGWLAGLVALAALVILGALLVDDVPRGPVLGPAVGALVGLGLLVRWGEARRWQRTDEAGHRRLTRVLHRWDRRFPH